jgi:hypothetical protein
MNHKPGPGPAPSERTLFQLWDAIDRARERSGELAAQQLATKALKVIEPPKRKDDPR